MRSKVGVSLFIFLLVFADAIASDRVILESLLDQEFGERAAVVKGNVIYVWEGDIPIVQGFPPHWYRNELYNPLEHPRVCVYDMFGTMLDDSHHYEAYSTYWQKKLDYEQWLAQRKAKREELEALRSKRQIAIGMSEPYVRFILGIPKSIKVTEDIVSWDYNDNGIVWVLFSRGKVSSFMQSLEKVQ